MRKDGQVGGTTATSGGATWVPATTQARRAGAPDTVEAVRRYLDGEVGRYGAPELREAFYASGAEAIDYLERNSDVKYRLNNPYPDYHAEAAGGVLGGRTLSPLPFDGRLLGADFDLVRPPRPEFMVLGGMMVGRDEIKHLIRPWASLASFRLAARLVAKYLLDRLRYRRGTRLLLGNALVGRLLYSVRHKGADIAVNARLVELVRRGGTRGRRGGRHRRRSAAHPRIARRDPRDRRLRGRARLAREARAGHAQSPHTLAFEGDSGDGLDAAGRVGASLDRNHATPFFWMPASMMHWSDGRVATYPHIRDRPKPGLIAVNAAGRRFVNEGNSYHDFVEAQYRSHGDVPSIPAYLICDRRFVHEYGLGVIHPVWQRLPYFERRGYLTSAPTLAALAAKIGVDAEGLASSVREHNGFAQTGVDAAFGKGSKALNRHNGDAAHKPNPCLAPIATPPYYAVPVYPAPIGSSAGLATNADGEVVDEQGTVIAGLYACGNDMSSIMGGAYPGPGITIGPAVVFAYRAARHAAHKAVAREAQAA